MHPQMGRWQQLRGLPLPAGAVQGTRLHQKPLSAPPGRAERLPTPGAPSSHLEIACVSARIRALWAAREF